MYLNLVVVPVGSGCRSDVVSLINTFLLKKPKYSPTIFCFFASKFYTKINRIFHLKLVASFPFKEIGHLFLLLQ